MEKVSVYIDGFNMYFGMLAKKLHHCKWLDFYALAEDLLKPEQKLVQVNYFTARVRDDEEKQRRQNVYLEALEASGVNIIYGHYQSNHVKCYRCGHVWSNPNEKMTDVNIATHLLVDAYRDHYDTALLISGDSDLVPPIKAVLHNFGSKRIVAAFPPARKNIEVANSVSAYFNIGKRKLERNQLPEKIQKKDGFVLTKPVEWKS